MATRKQNKLLQQKKNNIALLNMHEKSILALTQQRHRLEEYYEVKKKLCLQLSIV